MPQTFDYTEIFNDINIKDDELLIEILHTERH